MTACTSLRAVPDTSPALGLRAYILLGRLGQGGMGRVHAAVRRADRRRLAIKFPLDDAPECLAGLQREIRALRLLRQDGVMRMVDHGVHGGLPWYAMVRVDGGDLRRYAVNLWAPFRALNMLTAATARSGVAFANEREEQACTRPPAAAGKLREVAAVFRALAQSVTKLHEQGCTHGDLKPSNVLLRAGRPIIIDFGQCLFDGEADEGMQRGCTAEYCSPEQVAGSPAGPESDLYALGCVLYELIAGRTAFRRCDRLLQQWNTQPLPVSELVEGVSPSLDAALSSLLCADPGARPLALRDVLATLP